MKKYFLIGFYLVIGLAMPSQATFFDKAGVVRAEPTGGEPINANATTPVEPIDQPVEPKPIGDPK